jgi:uncharacterized protein (TIGR03437 family)
VPPSAFPERVAIKAGRYLAHACSGPASLDNLAPTLVGKVFWKLSCRFLGRAGRQTQILIRIVRLNDSYMSQLLRHSSPICILFTIASAAGQTFPAPAPVFSKIFGGSSGWDFANSLAVDPQGNVAVVGTTSSPDFPVTSAFQQQITHQPLIASTGAGDLSYPQLGGAVDVTTMAESADGAALYAASSSGIFRSLDGGVTWSQQLPGLAGANTLAVDAGSQNTLYAGVPGNQGLSAGAFFKSVDGGQHWSFVGLAAVSNTYYGIVALAAPPQAPATVYAQINALYRTRDGGSSWTALAPNGYFIYAFGLAPSDPNVVYAVASDGLVYRSADGGDTWAAAGGRFGNAPPNPMASAVAVDPEDKNTVWIVAGNNLFKSTDAGATFQVVLNANGLRGLSLSPTRGRLLAGAWASTDNGTTWRSISPYGNSGFATRTTFFIETHASTDGFVTKWSADGSHTLFSTFLSGAQSTGVAEDSAGNTYVVGFANSPFFPVTNGGVLPSNGEQVPFLTKFDPQGNLQFSDLLGLSGVSAIAIGANGNVYLAGTVRTCPDGGTVPRTLQFDSQGNLLASRTISEMCGHSGSANGIAVDLMGNLYLIGSTDAPNLLTSATAIEPSFPASIPRGYTAIFLLRLSPQLDRITYLSYLGQSNVGSIGIAVDPAGNVYVSGGASSFPAPIQTTSDLTLPADCGPNTEHAFVMKLNPSSSAPLWLTVWGGGCNDFATSVAVDDRGDVWAGGQTRSNNFPTVSPLMVRGITDGMLTELSPDGKQILFSSFVPGNFALGPQDSVYITGSVIPYPRKIDTFQAVLGVAGPTSILVERLDATATRAAVIESITSLNPSTLDRDPLFFWIGPGEMIRLHGKGLGPANAAGAELDASGKVSTSVAGTRVLFDGVPAPLISVQESAIVCMTPFAIGPRASTSIQVERNGVAVPGVSVAVRPVAAQPDVLAIANQDGTANSQSNPAHWGQTITLYVTGFGDTVPPVPDGFLYQAPLPKPAVPLYSFSSYAGPAPGMLAGIWQINVPLGTSYNGSTGNPVPISILSQPMSGAIYPGIDPPGWVTQ